ncbi:MAG: dienelactone hydrolase family protein [Microbacterium sp.]|jgi:predicted alpha/beta-hydrolase family hydrolase|uniref:alpha/beta hydrolase family protein n=1 Tax=Microbacterium sp. TaxID=51671 RepID=UPI00281FCD89|nr:alpha/beta family hydrolase [Microbacterium sp.]MDR2322998.1 dienelactone hydrolase family protein [Microbacterium sp.]
MTALPEERFRIPVPLPAGTVEVSAAFGRASDDSGGDAAPVVAIAHGAGAGMDHPFLLGFSAALQAEGLHTLRFTFPYLEAGRRMPGPAAHAILAWRAVIAAARERGSGSVVACGKSYGGRMASMAAAEEAGLDADALVYLGYPLHQPGKPEKPRIEHLPAVTQPQLFVEGTNDPFVQPVSQLEDDVASCQDAAIVWIDGGGHSFEVKGRKRPADAIGADLAPLVAEFARSGFVIDASAPGAPRKDAEGEA